MADYLKAFKNIYEEKNNKEEIVWKVGEYYKILHETEDFIFPTNELLLKGIYEFETVDLIPKVFELMIPLGKLKGARVPLGFIRLTQEEVTKEVERENNNEKSK